jgi:hypothetical protein
MTDDAQESDVTVFTSAVINERRGDDDPFRAAHSR